MPVVGPRDGQGEHRDQLLEMAATWEKLAADRSELVRRHPELGLTGEHAEEVVSEPGAGTAMT